MSCRTSFRRGKGRYRSAAVVFRVLRLGSQPERPNVTFRAQGLGVVSGSWLVIGLPCERRSRQIPLLLVKHSLEEKPGETALHIRVILPGPITAVLGVVSFSA
jgi:hypothetical protein